MTVLFVLIFIVMAVYAVNVYQEEIAYLQETGGSGVDYLGTGGSFIGLFLVGIAMFFLWLHLMYLVANTRKTPFKTVSHIVLFVNLVLYGLSLWSVIPLDFGWLLLSLLVLWSVYGVILFVLHEIRVAKEEKRM